MDIIKDQERVGIVAINFNYENPALFKEEIKNSKIYKEFSLNDSKIIYDTFPKNELLEKQFENTPLLIGFVNNNDLEVVYIGNEKRLEIGTRKFSNLNKTQLIELSKKVSKMRMADISAIGINILAVYNTKDHRLNLLNDNVVNKIPNWSKNITFQFVLPLKFDDYLATYKVQKIEGGTDTDKDYLYLVDSNFNFDFTEDRTETEERTNKFNHILENFDDYYGQFQQVAEEIVQL